MFILCFFEIETKLKTFFFTKLLSELEGWWLGCAVWFRNFGTLSVPRGAHVTPSPTVLWKTDILKQMFNTFFLNGLSFLRCLWRYCFMACLLLFFLCCRSWFLTIWWSVFILFISIFTLLFPRLKPHSVQLTIMENNTKPYHKTSKYPMNSKSSLKTKHNNNLIQKPT